MIRSKKKKDIATYKLHLKPLRTPVLATLDNSKEKLKNGPKTPKMTQNGQKHQKQQKRPKNTKNHQKWPKTPKNAKNRKVSKMGVPKMAPRGPEKKCVTK